jgi:hypothetical protein
LLTGYTVGGVTREPLIDFDRFYAESEQPGCPQSHEISISSLESSQRWLQYFLPSGTAHRHAGWAHFFDSVVAIQRFPSFE